MSNKEKKFTHLFSSFSSLRSSRSHSFSKFFFFIFSRASALRSLLLKNSRIRKKISWSCSRSSSCHRYDISQKFLHSNSSRRRHRTSLYQNFLSLSRISFNNSFHLHVLRRLFVSVYHFFVFFFSFVCCSVVALSSWIISKLRSFVFVRRSRKYQF